jgi:hypothetical protein
MLAPLLRAKRPAADPECSDPWEAAGRKREG